MERINTLTNLNPSPEEIFNKVKEKVPDAEKMIYQVDNPWSGIKLAIHAYYIDIYVTIAKKYFKEIYYVDAFAGSGIIAIKIRSDSEKIFFYGSPILSILVPQNKNVKFDKYFFIEVDENRALILKKVIEVLHEHQIVNKDNVKILIKDMNKVPYKSLLRNCKHSLVFVDPEGLEPKWSTISSILDLPTDVLFNFMTSGIRRIWGTVKSKGVGDEALNSFYGDDSWRIAENDEDLLQIYKDKIEREFPRRIVTNVRVRGDKLFYYDILTITRRTKRGSPWLIAINERLKPHVEQTDSETFTYLLEIFKGKLKPLPLYFRDIM
ncbi:MAG: three-Cys-motif partner protein TcmP [Thermofilaceae archaeon]